MTWIQRWADVLFLHFPVEANQVQCRLPYGIEIDTFEGQAWIGYIFFRLNVRPAWLPALPGFSSLLELNMRTYVRCAGRPGIYFLRMYADNRLAIAASRLLTPLCYEPAKMIDEWRPDGARHIECWPAKTGAGSFCLDYSNDSSATELSAGSLDQWLLERYCLFVAQRNGELLEGDVEHAAWRASRVQPVRLHDTLSRDLGDPSDRRWLMHFSPGVVARFQAFVPVRPIAYAQPQPQALVTD
jgi:uncharacterized protein